MKLKLFFVTALFLFMQMFNIAFAQITTVKLYLSYLIVEPGDEFSMFLYVMSELPAAGDPNEVTSANMGITWDENVLEFSRVQFGPAVPENWTMSSNVGINTCDVEMSGTEPITEQSGILIYVFKAIGTAPDTTWVRFTESIFNNGDPAITTDDGRVIIEDQPPYSLTVNTDPPEGGSVTKDPDKSEYNQDEVVTLTAVPNQGYRFVEWTGDATGTNSTVTITMNSDKTITAHFELIAFILTVNIDPPEAGSVMKDPDKLEYLQNEVVTLTAIPNDGYRFVEWTGDVTGTDSVVNLTMDSDKAVTAHFEIIPFTLTVYAYPPEGGSVTKDPNKSGYDHGEEVTLTAIPNEGYRFLEWTGDITGTDPVVTITMNSDITVTAHFEMIPFILTVNTDPSEGGSVLKDPDKSGYDHGEVVTLTAVANDGYRFVEWTGDVTGTDSVVTLTMDSDKIVTAHFEIVPFTLTTYAYPTEGGSAIKNPNKSGYDHGEVVTLTAIPNEGYRFVEWTGDVTGTDSVVTLTMDSDKTVTAQFELAPFILTVIIDPSEGGAVLKNPDKSGYDHGEVVTLTAVPSGGYRFVEWTGSITGIDSIVTVTMNSDKTVTAHFRTYVPGKLTLYLDKGWNMISINVALLDPDIITVMSPIVDKLKIVKDDSGRKYIPEQGINTIGHINFKEGYQIYMNEAATLEVAGEVVDPATPIILPIEWSMISYLPILPMNVDSALVSIKNQSMIIKNNSGQTYIPRYGINNIRKMQPGEGYQIYLNTIDTLIYPAGGEYFAATAITDGKNEAINTIQNLTEHFQFTSNTGENAIIIIITDSELRYSDGSQLEIGDEIGIFSSEGSCCGAIIWENVNAAITVWGDDNQTESIDGFQTGDTLRYRVYRKSSNKEYPAMVTYQENNPSLYQPNGFSTITKLVANISPTDVSDKGGQVTSSNFELFQNYPNPFNPDTRIDYQIPVSAYVKIKIFNMLGQHIKSLVNEHKEAGYHTVTWDRTDNFGNEVPSGIYIYWMSAQDFVMNKKMIIMK